MASQEQRGRFFDQKAETATADARRQGLERRFLDTLRQAARSRAYQEVHAQAGVDPLAIRGLEDLARLPILRLDDLLRRQKQDPPFGGFETRPAEEFNRIYVNPGFIWQPGRTPLQDTSWAQALAGGGLLAGDRVLNTFSYHLWPYAHLLDESAHMLGAQVVPSGGGNAFMQVRIMRRLGIKAYLGTPSFLMTLAQRAEAMGLDPARDLPLEAAVVGAEMLPESLRTRLGQMLDISVRQAYGTVYLGCLGYECREAKGLHVPEGALVEVVDPQTGQAQAPGRAGEVVASCLDPDYPMLRLATGDLSMWATGDCPCGRTGPRLQRILGRIDQAVKVRGTFVHPWQIDEIFATRPQVFKYQATVSRRQDQDLLAVLVELREGVVREPRHQRELEQELRDFLGIRGEVELVPPGTIPDFHGKIVDRRDWD
ncbi:MAG: AMP-binding protein [Pseudomonadota bacterium]